MLVHLCRIGNFAEGWGVSGGCGCAAGGCELGGVDAGGATWRIRPLDLILVAQERRSTSCQICEL